MDCIECNSKMEERKGIWYCSNCGNVYKGCRRCGVCCYINPCAKGKINPELVTEDANPCIYLKFEGDKAVCGIWSDVDPVELGFGFNCSYDDDGDFPGIRDYYLGEIRRLIK